MRKTHFACYYTADVENTTINHFARYTYGMEVIEVETNKTIQYAIEDSVKFLESLHFNVNSVAKRELYLGKD